VSGLPPLLLLTQDDLSILSEFGPPQWGIFDEGGQPVLISESVGELGYHRGYDVSNYPQEMGAFASYNKVQIPYDARVTLLSSQTRGQLLSILEPVAASLQLVAVVMPEYGYPSANVVDYEFRRTVRSGVTLIAVEVRLKEIRTPTTSTLSSSQGNSTSPAGAGAGTSRPVGQVSNQALGGGLTSSLFPSATSTSSTNAAFPTQSGPVQPTDRSSLTSPWVAIQPPT
jgi:hypothetical protein